MTPRPPKSTTPTIALVDDYIPMRKFIAEYLTQQGFKVVCEANNGEEFIKYLLQAETPPDLCLLDLIMPVLNGHETMRRLNVYYPHIRTLAYSSCEFKEEIERILQYGAHGYFSKGGSPADLKKALFNLMHVNPPIEPFFDLLFPIVT